MMLVIVGPRSEECPEKIPKSWDFQKEQFDSQRFMGFFGIAYVESNPRTGIEIWCWHQPASRCLMNDLGWNHGLMLVGQGFWFRLQGDRVSNTIQETDSKNGDYATFRLNMAEWTNQPTRFYPLVMTNIAIACYSKLHLLWENSI